MIEWLVIMNNDGFDDSAIDDDADVDDDFADLLYYIGIFDDWIWMNCNLSRMLS